MSFPRTPKSSSSKGVFRARLPSIFITCHKIPRMPRNLHGAITCCSPDNAIRKTRNTARLKWCACHANDDGGLQSAAPVTKNATHLLKTPETQNDF